MIDNIAFLPAWAVMWALAAGLFFLFKICILLESNGLSAWPDRACFIFLWPGMDPRPFANGCPPPVVSHSILPGMALALIGIALIWEVAPLMPHPTLRGWVGMTGLVCFLHFGCFRLLACWWQRRGIPVRPIMANPLAATNLAAFWGKLWNRAFSDFANRMILRPLARRFGLTWGIVAVFAFSGLTHELVISLPAGAGYGGPMAYFVIQGFGVLFERSTGGRRWQKERPHLTRVLMWLTLLAPAYWLFHPPFMHRVMAPFLQTLHA